MLDPQGETAVRADLRRLGAQEPGRRGGRRAAASSNTHPAGIWRGRAPPTAPEKDPPPHDQVPAGGVGGIAVPVPVLGIATGAVMGVLGDAWLTASMALTAAAVGVLSGFVLPRQGELLDQLTGRGSVEHRVTAQLAMFMGIFNLLRATVTVLVIVRPGSTTGA